MSLDLPEFFREKQVCVHNQVHNENLSLAEMQYNNEIQEMVNKMKLYQNKLINIKKDIKLIHEKSTKLKVL